MLSRRELFGAAATAGTLAVLGPMAGPLLTLGPVVSFHRDAPYFDPTGTAPPYRARIANDWGARLDDEALLRLGVIL